MMADQLVMQAPSAAEIRAAFERIEKDAMCRESGFEGRALRNYLLHTLLAVSGRHDELFEFNVAVEQPDYVLFDTGRRLEGRAAIVEFHREQASGGASLCVPMDQRVAMGPWGFAGEQTMHRYLMDGTLQRARSALVWRCDEKGRMKSLRFYPASEHEGVRLSAPPVSTATIAAELSPLIERLK